MAEMQSNLLVLSPFCLALSSFDQHIIEFLSLNFHQKQAGEYTADNLKIWCHFTLIIYFDKETMIAVRLIKKEWK